MPVAEYRETTVFQRRQPAEFLRKLQAFQLRVKYSPTGPVLGWGVQDIGF